MYKYINIKKMKFITFFIYIYIILYYIMQLNTASCNYENNYLNTNDYTELKLAYSNLLSRSNLLQSNYFTSLHYHVEKSYSIAIEFHHCYLHLKMF